MYAMANPYEKYKQQGVLTANPLELVVMLYDGCIKQLKLARMALEEKKLDQVNTALQKAQLIIMELINSLDLSYTIAKDLMNIYDFMLRQIIEINVTKDQTMIESLLNMLQSLRDAWAQIQKTQKIAVPALEE